MLVEQRRNQLLELVRARRFASLPELVEQLAVSESTVRRDLEYLEEQGVAAKLENLNIKPELISARLVLNGGGNG